MDTQKQEVDRLAVFVGKMENTSGDGVGSNHATLLRGARCWHARH